MQVRRLAGLFLTLRRIPSLSFEKDLYMKKIKVILILLLAINLFFGCDNGDDPTPELSAPLAMNANNITQSSFTARWTGVTGAESYLLDVSDVADFSSYVSGYQAKSVSGGSDEVTILNASTDYYYRLKASNSEVQSPYSNVVSLTTLIPDDVPLKEAATKFYVGTIVQANRMTGSHKEIINAEFSSITAEYQMKMNIMYPNQDEYNWTESDAIVQFAQDNGLNMHGHALIWHNSVPDWVTNFTGTDAEFEAMVEDYIKTTVTRYKGKVKSWDVVNEGISDGSSGLRPTVFSNRMGDDYMEKCFTWAHEADPDVLLFYNDYSVASDQSKQNGIFALVDNLKSKGVPIHGVGMQMHISYNWPAKADIETAAQKIVDRNLLVHFSEIDVRANPDNNQSSLTASRSLEQKAKYKEVVEIYAALPEVNQYAITVWGLRDNESWLINFWGHADWPLLYDSNFNKKDAYYGFLEGLLN